MSNQHFRQMAAESLQENAESIRKHGGNQMDADTMDGAAARIKELEAKLTAAEELSQGYYNEASEGWTKFREAERKFTAEEQEHIEVTISTRNLYAKTLADLKAKLAAVNAKYHDLIFEVGKKHPNETRHETAKRYLREAETSNSGPDMGSAEGKS